MDKLATGIAGLDKLLEGGLPESSAIGLIGDVDSGKEIICNQIVWSLLNRDYSILYYAVDKPSEDVRANMVQYNWNVDSYEKDDRLHFVDAFSSGMKIIAEKMYEKGEMVSPDRINFNFKDMISEGRNYALKQVLLRKKLFVVYYSMSPLFTVTDEREVLRFLQYAKYATRISNAIGIATLHLGIHGTNIENAFQQLADGIIELKKKSLDGYAARFLRINKMARTKISESYYPLEITPNGVVVHPFPVTSM